MNKADEIKKKLDNSMLTTETYIIEGYVRDDLAVGGRGFWVALKDGAKTFETESETVARKAFLKAAKAHAKYDGKIRLVKITREVIDS